MNGDNKINGPASLQLFFFICLILLVEFISQPRGCSDEKEKLLTFHLFVVDISFLECSKMKSFFIFEYFILLFFIFDNKKHST